MRASGRPHGWPGVSAAAPLRPEDVSALAATLAVRNFQPGGVIFSAGEPAAGVWIVREGAGATFPRPPRPGSKAASRRGPPGDCPVADIVAAARLYGTEQAGTERDAWSHP